MTSARLYYILLHSQIKQVLNEYATGILIFNSRLFVVKRWWRHCSNSQPHKTKGNFKNNLLCNGNLFRGLGELQIFKKASLLHFDYMLEIRTEVLWVILLKHDKRTPWNAGRTLSWSWISKVMTRFKTRVKHHWCQNIWSRFHGKRWC